MFIRKTATKWWLDKDAKMLLGSILVYMRNEFRAGESAVSFDHPNQQSSAIEGASVNYRKMQQCVDRILSRLDGTWDAHKLNLAMSILSRAMDSADERHLGRRIINASENAHDVLAIDSLWNRSARERDCVMDRETGEFPPIKPDNGEGIRPLDTYHVDNGPV
jgi:hypothetical protein